MTTRQDRLRSDLRALITSTPGLPEYSIDENATQRVGKVIGGTAGHDERHVRSSDSRSRLTTDKMPGDHHSEGPNIWLWTVLLCTPVCTVVLLVVLAYWRFG